MLWGERNHSQRIRKQEVGYPLSDSNELVSFTLSSLEEMLCTCFVCVCVCVCVTKREREREREREKERERERERERECERGRER